MWLFCFTSNIFWRDFSKMYVFEIIVRYLVAMVTWAYIWLLYSADLCFCFVTALWCFLILPVQFDMQPRIIIFLLRFPLLSKVFIVGILWVCLHMNFKIFKKKILKKALELNGDCIVSVDCLEYCNHFHNIIFFQSIIMGGIFILYCLALFL